MRRFDGGGGCGGRAILSFWEQSSWEWGYKTKIKLMSLIINFFLARFTKLCSLLGPSPYNTSMPLSFFSAPPTPPQQCNAPQRACHGSPAPPPRWCRAPEVDNNNDNEDTTSPPTIVVDIVPLPPFPLSLCPRYSMTTTTMQPPFPLSLPLSPRPPLSPTLLP
jgi:hypothetical protein